MATELAKAYVQIIPSAKGMQGKISEELGGEVSSAGTSSGNSFSSFFTKAVIASGAAVAVGKVFSDAFSEGAALQQSLGGVDTLFKESAEKLKGYANEAYKTAGMSANDYMQTVTSFSASLLSGLGGDTDKAADVANMALIDMSDNANKFGTDMESIQYAYQGFAKQNYVMLDNLKLGYGGTKTEMQRLLADAQKLTGVKYDINNLSDVYNAIHAIQGNLDITGTTAKESAATWSGSLASVKASYQNLMANLMLGNDLTPYLQSFATTVTTFFAGNFLPAVVNILKGLPTAIFTIITTLAPQLITLGGSLITNLMTGITSLMTNVTTGGNSTISSFINGIVTGLPQLILSASQCITDFLSTISANLPSVIQNGGNLLSQFINGILSQLPTLINSVVSCVLQFIDTVISLLPQILITGGDLLMQFINGILSQLPTLITSVMTSINEFIGTVVKRLPDILSAGKDLLLKLVDGIINNLPDIIASAFSAIMSFRQTIAENLPTILQSGISILGEFVAGIWQRMPTLISKIAEMISSMVDTFLSVDWLSIGMNIIIGIAKGLADYAGSLWDAVKGLLGSFKDNVLSFFGIHSPSRWGIYVGEMIDTGFANGITDNMSPISKAVGELEDEATKPFSSDFAYSLASGDVSASYSSDSSSVVSRLDTLISMMERSILNGNDTKIVLNNREMARSLKEMGVAFV